MKQPIFVRSRDGVIATVFGEALLLRLQTIDKLHLPKDRSLTAEDLRVLRRQSVWYLLEREV